MRAIFILVFCLIHLSSAQAQTKSPAAFLGYELGSRFTPHHRVVAYFEHVAALNDHVVLEYYGETVEHRPLLLAYVSSKSHIDRLDQVREDNLRRAGLLEGTPQTQLPVTWLSYNVHGNEAVSSEAAMMTLYATVDPQQKEVSGWLENTLLVIDPCLNPDGHERYVAWYAQKAHGQLQPDPQSMEHQEPWPSGRPNHYLFDLNRDWVWQTQLESQQRMKLYNSWLPHVHVDFHEMGIDAPYYFAPAAEPLHEQLSPFQQTFQEWFGRNTARYFDENDWFYYTKEDFDLLYPSYGDTYPMYTGAIGMTIEQGGSGRAGLGMLNSLGDTVTLTDRILHHHTTAVSAIETTATHSQQVVNEFAEYYRLNSAQPKSRYKSFVIKASNAPDKVQSLLDLLDKNGIRYGKSGRRAPLSGFHYQKGTTEKFTMEPEDLIITAYQPKSVLTQVLFEPEPVLTDSLTYDITTWALPYAFNLEAYALETRLDPGKAYEAVDFQPNQPDPATLAYLAPWNAINHAQFLSALMQAGIRVRNAAHPFRIGEDSYPVDTLIIARGGNERVVDFHQTVTNLANTFAIPLGKTSTGFVDSGKDFGSAQVKTLKAPKLAVIGGASTNSLNVGELWHFFEKELAYPFSMLDWNVLASLDLSSYEVIVLPSGNFGDLESPGIRKLLDWVQQGGRLIAMEEALVAFADQEGAGLKKYRNEEEKGKLMETAHIRSEEELTAPYQLRERLRVSEEVIGAVLQVEIDDTHPLGYGTGGTYYTLKYHAARYAYLENGGVNVGYIPSMANHRAGFIGANAKAPLEKSLVIGQEPYGKGNLVYFVDNPLFRGFWENGKLLMANAVFLGSR